MLYTYLQLTNQEFGSAGQLTTLQAALPAVFCFLASSLTHNHRQNFEIRNIPVRSVLLTLGLSGTRFSRIDLQISGSEHACVRSICLESQYERERSDGSVDHNEKVITHTCRPSVLSSVIRIKISKHQSSEPSLTSFHGNGLSNDLRSEIEHRPCALICSPFDDSNEGSFATQQSRTSSRARRADRRMTQRSRTNAPTRK